jgi:hypothetical protein
LRWLQRYSVVVRKLLVVSAVTISAIASGCSSDGQSTDNARIVRAGSPAQVRDGKLTADPSPITFAEITKKGSATPAGAVLAMYFWTQWGSIPNVVAMYDPQVRAALGSATIADAYVDQRAALLATQVVVRDVVRSRLGTVVTVDGLSKNYPANRDSFLLSRRNGRWYIVQDTVLERGLAAIAGARASRGLTGAAAARRAQTAGAAAARRYRNLELRLVSPGRPAARRR